VTPSAPRGETPAVPSPENAPADGHSPNAAAVRQMWPTVREKVRERSRTVEVMLAGAVVRAVEGNTLVLAHDSAPLARRLCEQRNADVIRDALKDALGVNWQVRCEAGGVGGSAPAGPPAPVPESTDARRAGERAEEDDMIAEAVRDDEDPAPRRDPEEAALELLQSELGARRIDR
jgi:DNA polymerase-3 subunit gamma/tau